MPVDTLSLVRQAEPDLPLRDLDRVALTAVAVTDGGDRMEPGTQGTIVGVWRGGAAYEVEFAQPPGALATVEAEDLRLVEHGPV
jgi:hypothetical protein